LLLLLRKSLTERKKEMKEEGWNEKQILMGAATSGSAVVSECCRSIKTSS